MSLAVRVFGIAVVGAFTQPLAALELPPIKTGAGNHVPACATPGRLTAYLRSRNAQLDRSFDALAAAYQRHGENAGIRWDFAFFQMIVETGNLTFRRPNGAPGAVRSEQNNFAGIGASGGGIGGEFFASADAGVMAHLQHVRIYAGDRIASPIAERTRKVQAWGILATWQRQLARPVTFADLAEHWAASDKSYGPSILSVARRFYTGLCLEPDPAPALVAATKAPVVERVALAPAAAAPVVAPPAATARAELPPGEALARAALARSAQESPATRQGLGGQAMIKPVETPAAPVPLRSVKILNATPVSTEPAIPQPAAPVVAAIEPAAQPVSAPDGDPADEALRQLVTGRTVNLDTPLGSIIPISFQADGTTRGRAGSLASYLGSPSDEGRWWVERARLCQRWKVWFDRETQCLRFRQAGDVIHWTRDDGRKGTARLAKQ